MTALAATTNGSSSHLNDRGSENDDPNAPRSQVKRNVVASDRMSRHSSSPKPRPISIGAQANQEPSPSSPSAASFILRDLSVNTSTLARPQNTSTERSPPPRPEDTPIEHSNAHQPQDTPTEHTTTNQSTYTDTERTLTLEPQSSSTMSSSEVEPIRQQEISASSGSSARLPNGSNQAQGGGSPSMSTLNNKPNDPGSRPRPARQLSLQHNDAVTPDGTQSRKSSISRAATFMLSNSTPQSPTSPLSRHHTVNLGNESEAGRRSPRSSTAPRSARSITRKRMSLGYVSTPSPSGSTSFPVGDDSPTLALQRLHGQGPCSISIGESSLKPLKSNGAADATKSHTTGEDGQTVMDLNKTILAEIAKRERRIGELKKELSTEEKELKALRTKWQKSVTRDLAAGNGPLSNPSTSTRSEDAKAMPPPASPAWAGPTRSAPGTGSESSAVSSSNPAASSAAVQAGVMDTFRGFSAKLPSSLGTQLNALLDGMNEGLTAAQVSASNSMGIPPSPRLSQLPMLEEEEDGEERSPTSATSAKQATYPPPPSTSSRSNSISQQYQTAGHSQYATASTATPSSSSASSRTTSTLFSSLTSLRDQLDNAFTPPALQAAKATGDPRVSGTSFSSSSSIKNNSIAHPSSTSSSASTAAVAPLTSTSTESTWSTWSLGKLREVAARAEKAIGDAIVVEQAAVEDQARNLGLLSRDPLSPKVGGGGGGAGVREKERQKDKNKSRGTSPTDAASNAPPSTRRQSTTKTSGSVLAHGHSQGLGLGLGPAPRSTTSTTTSTSTSMSTSSSATTPTSRTPSRQTSHPRPLSPRTLMALAKGDGIAPEDLLDDDEDVDDDDGGGGKEQHKDTVGRGGGGGGES